MSPLIDGSIQSNPPFTRSTARELKNLKIRSMSRRARFGRGGGGGGGRYISIHIFTFPSYITLRKSSKKIKKRKKTERKKTVRKKTVRKKERKKNQIYLPTYLRARNQPLNPRPPLFLSKHKYLEHLLQLYISNERTNERTNKARKRNETEWNGVCKADWIT